MQDINIHFVTPRPNHPMVYILNFNKLQISWGFQLQYTVRKAEATPN